MKTRVVFMTVIITCLMFTASAFAQVKVMTVIQDDDSVTVFVDTLNNANRNPAAVFFDDELSEMPFDIDSILQVNAMNIEEMMKTLPYQIDSLDKKMGMFAFDFDDDLFNNAMPSDSMLKKMMDVNVQVNVDTLEDGSVVKKIIVLGDEADQHHKIIKKGKQYIIVSGDDDWDEEGIAKGESEFEPEDIIVPVTTSDMHLLKKAGFSSNLLTSEPLEFKQENINIEREKTDDKDILEIELKATLPSKAKTTVSLIDKNGSETDEENFKNTEKINIKYKLDKASAPYYLLVVQDKKLWSRKLDF